jgi:hypothetical protein
VRKPAKIGKIALGKLKIMSTLNHGAHDLGNSLNLIEVFSDFRIGFSYMVLIVSPSRHTMSPLSGNPIIAFSFCFINFAARRFLRFLSELMEKHIGIVLVEEVQHSIIPRTQFPYAILQMLCDVFAQAGSVVFKDDSKNAFKNQVLSEKR